jgi:acetyl-CoA carboxylase alpha subunit
MDTKRRRDEIHRLEKDLDDLRRIAAGGSPDPDIEHLRDQVNELKREFFANMGAWQRTQLARHPQRPYTLDYTRLLFTDFSELHGDRLWRRCRARDRHGQISQQAGNRHWPPEGKGHQAAPGAQFWPEQA